MVISILEYSPRMQSTVANIIRTLTDLEADHEGVLKNGWACIVGATVKDRDTNGRELLIGVGRSSTAVYATAEERMAILADHPDQFLSHSGLAAPGNSYGAIRVPYQALVTRETSVDPVEGDLTIAFAGGTPEQDLEHAVLVFNYMRHFTREQNPMVTVKYDLDGLKTDPVVAHQLNVWRISTT